MISENLSNSGFGKCLHWSSKRAFVPSKGSSPYCCHGSRKIQHIRNRRNGNDYREAVVVPYVATKDAVVAEVEDASEDTRSFDWFKNWWAVQAVCNLQTDRPNKITLLSKDFIVWKGHSGEWIAMEDQCPHRMAPLSEGRIESDGNLLCSYHAWRFAENGKCVKIPHAESEKAQFVACSSPRSTVKTYPCKARGGLVWIWPDDSISAYIDSATSPLPIEDMDLDFFEQEFEEKKLNPFIRYVPYNFDVLMENIADLSHLPVSHHGTVPGMSRYNIGPYVVNQNNAANPTSSLIRALFTPTNPSGLKSIIELRPPGTIITEIFKEDEKTPWSASIYLMSPVSPGKSRFLGAATTRDASWKRRSSNPIERALTRFMSCIIHLLLANSIIDDDAVFLHEQDKKVRTFGSNTRKDEGYFLPTNADTIVMTFRKWFETVGGYGEAYGNNKSLKSNENLTKRQLLDRYEQHTIHCNVCRNALQSVKTAISFFKILSLFFLSTTAFMLVRASIQPSFTWRIVLKQTKLMTSAIFLVLFMILAKFLENTVIPLFYYKETSHADKD